MNEVRVSTPYRERRYVVRVNCHYCSYSHESKDFASDCPVCGSRVQVKILSEEGRQATEPQRVLG